MEDELQAYLKATAKQLMTAACTDQVQVGLLQSAGRRYGLTGGALDDFVVALARTLISDGRLYEFQPDNAGGWHGYPIPGNEAPIAVLRGLRDNGAITNAEYNRMRRGD
jgi:hypothetical protein